MRQGVIYTKRMKRIFPFIVLVFLPLVSAGCASIKAVIRPAGTAENAAAQAALPPYSGPKARIAMADFEVKAAKATSEIGLGLREMLTAALLNSGRFSVTERQVQSQAASGQEPAASAVLPADLIITAAVTEFEPQASGGRAGLGGGGGVGSGVLGGLLGSTLNKAHIALDIRIVNASTSEVLASTRVQGQASDISGGFMGSWALGSGLSAYANTPMEKAIRICLVEAVRYISQTVAPNYYKY